MNNDMKILPCPFCGGEAELIQTKSGYTSGQPIKILNQYIVECEECGIHTKTYESEIYQLDDGIVHIDKNGAVDAIDAWNRRAGEQE